jgi:hypothetical protein
MGTILTDSKSTRAQGCALSFLGHDMNTTQDVKRRKKRRKDKKIDRIYARYVRLGYTKPIARAKAILEVNSGLY